MEQVDYKDYWKQYRDIKAEADIIASWHLGKNAIGEDLALFAEAGNVTVEWLKDCIQMFYECPVEIKVLERITPGMNKKKYLEKYVRGK